MLGRKDPQPPAPSATNGHTNSTPVSLLTVIGDTAKMEGKFDIADSIQIECEMGGELKVGGKLVIGEKGVVNANVETVDAIIMGHYDGNMTATGPATATLRCKPCARIRCRLPCPGRR